MFKNFIVRQEPFLNTCEISYAVLPLAQRATREHMRLALYQITLSDPSAKTLTRMSSNTSELYYTPHMVGCDTRSLAVTVPSRNEMQD